MGKKKGGNPTSQKKLELPSSATPATQPTPTAAVAAAIKQECDRASNALRRSNPAKALRLLKEAAPKFQKEALFHRFAGRIIVKAAEFFEDHTVKLRHFKTAAEYVKKAVSLSPNSVEFACFYATLLIDVANEPREYEQVVVECERALALENPIDPATEELVWDNTVPFTAEAKARRIAAVHLKLKSLVERANIANLSLWLKDWSGKGGGDEDKLKLAPMRRSMENLAKVMDYSGMSRRPPKTLEDKREEIKVRVAVLRSFQQTTELQAAEKSNQEDCGEQAASGSGSTSPTRNYGERGQFSVFGATPPIPRG